MSLPIHAAVELKSSIVLKLNILPLHKKTSHHDTLPRNVEFALVGERYVAAASNRGGFRMRRVSSVAWKIVCQMDHVLCDPVPFENNLLKKHLIWIPNYGRARQPSFL